MLQETKKIKYCKKYKMQPRDITAIPPPSPPPSFLVSFFQNLKSQSVAVRLHELDGRCECVLCGVRGVVEESVRCGDCEGRETETDRDICGVCWRRETETETETETERGVCWRRERQRDRETERQRERMEGVVCSKHV